jgi:hypothetical protein
MSQTRVVHLAILILAVSCLLVTAAASEPSATIIAPAQSDPGDLVILRTKTVGTGHRWVVIPEKATGHFLPVIDSSGQQAAVFASSKPGVYVFILAVAEGGNVAMAKHVLTQGPAPES